jgi:eukaryotic-like serine/threonine-protein kinase
MAEGSASLTRTGALARLDAAEQTGAAQAPSGLASPFAALHEHTEPLSEHAPDPLLDSAALSFARERETALTRAEHSASARRLQRALSIGVCVWAASTLLDLYVSRVAHEANLKLLLALQGIGTLVAVLPIVWLRAVRTPTLRTLWACDVLAFTSVSAVASLESLVFRGIDSPYAAGILVILLTRATTTFSPWRQGALLFGAPALAYPLIVGVASRYDARIAAQLNDPAALSAFFSMLFFIGTSWLMLTLGGHYVWRLRRDAAEARNIGRYRLERRLGSGGMADVWQAFDLTLKLRVAVKTVAGNRHDAGRLARFEREVRALAQLSHPNVVRVLDYGVTDDGLWYYAMELLEGENLRELVAREGALPVQRAVCIARQVLGALGEAHRKGIVHRDIKAENVFLARLGGEADVAKLLDFGVAKASVSSDISLTHAGHVVGTPAYMAPELALGQPADARSDLYSFGVMLYFLLSARLPFPEETAAGLLAAHLMREPEPLTSPGSPPALAAAERVILRCLAKAPSARYASTHELLEALQAAAA